jgi:5-hydroxyisourate hydrolase-like protein (transthyretin family)
LLAIACLSAQAQTKPAAHAAAASGFRIAGTVVNAVTGEPVRGATVAALAVADSHTVSSVETGEDGHFSLTGLGVAKYQLTASRRGFRTAFFDEHDEYSTAIVTGPDQETERLTFRLTPGGVIHGVVLTDGGDPVNDARVMLFRKASAARTGPRMNQSDATTSDDTGAYEFANLAPGEYTVAVVAEPWYADNRAPKGKQPEAGGEANTALDVAYPVTYFDSTTEEASATPLVVTGGSRQEADITLHAVPALHIQVQTPRKADGSIARAEMRQMVFGVQVFAVSGGFFDAMENGTTEFRGVAPGQYELAQGDPPRIAELDATASQRIDPTIGTASVAVRGTVRSAAGPFPVNAMLMLVPADGARRQNPISAACIRGAFNFESVPPGEWELQVGSTGAPNSKPMAVMTITVDGATRSGDGITVRDRPLTVQATVNEGMTEVEGFARRDGKGVAGVMMVLVPKNLGALKTLARRDQSDSDGSFSLRDVVPGQYTLVAIEDGWDLDWSEPEVIRRYLLNGVAVTVSDNAGKLLTLPAAVPVQSRQP